MKESRMQDENRINNDYRMLDEVWMQDRDKIQNEHRTQVGSFNRG